MKKAILLLTIFGIILLSNLAYAQTIHYYEINLKYNRGEITLNSIQVKPVIDEEDLENIEGGYIAEVKSFYDEVLNLTFFDIPTTIIYDNFDEETGEAIGGGIIELNETKAIINVPYFENAKEINIYDKEINKKLTIDVSDYAKVKAEKQELVFKKEEQIQQKPKIEPKSKENYLTYVSVLAIVAVAILMLYLYKKHKKIG